MLYKNQKAMTIEGCHADEGGISKIYDRPFLRQGDNQSVIGSEERTKNLTTIGRFLTALAFEMTALANKPLNFKQTLITLQIIFRRKVKIRRLEIRF